MLVTSAHFREMSGRVSALGQVVTRKTSWGWRDPLRARPPPGAVSSSRGSALAVADGNTTEGVPPPTMPLVCAAARAEVERCDETLVT